MWKEYFRTLEEDKIIRLQELSRLKNKSHTRKLVAKNRSSTMLSNIFGSRWVIYSWKSYRYNLEIVIWGKRGYRFHTFELWSVLESFSDATISIIFWVLITFTKYYLVSLPQDIVRSAFYIFCQSTIQTRIIEAFNQLLNYRIADNQRTKYDIQNSLHERWTFISYRQ